jgi:uncharacterized RDD family membrane protein YckC
MEPKVSVPAESNATGRPPGLLRRWFANAVDGFLFGALTGILAVAFPLSLARDRGLQFLVSVVFLLYSAVLNSHLGGGRTLGKRLVGLRVVSLDGAPLSLDRSLARSAVLSYGPFAAIMLGSAARGGLPHHLLPPLASLQAAVGRVLLVACVLAIPFRELGRGFHDLIARSVVVHGEPDVAYLVAHRTDERDRRFVGLVLAVALVAAVASVVMS